MKKIWHDQAWEDYLNLQNDKKLLKKAKKKSNFAITQNWIYGC